MTRSIFAVFSGAKFATLLAPSVYVFFTLLLSIVPSEATATRNPAPAGFGTHGMAVFGGVDGLYAAHLPMFHAPHDVQMVMRFRLKDAATDLALRKNLSAKPALWTLDPDAFDLYSFAPQHAAPLIQFQARFVEGHFERGGKERYTKQTVIVEEVIFYRRLDFAKRVETAGRYLKIGKQREQFLVKVIDRRPDFDIIVALNGPQTPVEKASSAAVEEVIIPTDGLKSPQLTALQTALDAQGPGQYRVANIIYFETEDLK
jgi:hypothetical protein